MRAGMLAPTLYHRSSMIVRVGDHAWLFYVMPVAVDLSSKRSYVRCPLSGKAAIVHSLLAVLCSHNGY